MSSTETTPICHTLSYRYFAILTSSVPLSQTGEALPDLCTATFTPCYRFHLAGPSDHWLLLPIRDTIDSSVKTAMETANFWETWDKYIENGKITEAISYFSLFSERSGSHCSGKHV